MEILSSPGLFGGDIAWKQNTPAMAPKPRLVDKMDVAIEECRASAAASASVTFRSRRCEA